MMVEAKFDIRWLKSSEAPPQTDEACARVDRWSPFPSV
jgi:hypothetical protein